MAEQTIQQALAAVMAEVGAVGKDSTNQSQGFNFRGVDAVVNAASPRLSTHGIVPAPHVESAHYDTIPTRNGGTMRQCTLTVRYSFTGPAGDSLDCTVAAEAMDSGDKSTSKAMSVAYRTALIQVLCLRTDEPDPDEATYERAAPPPPVELVTAEEAEHMKALLNGASADDRKAFVARFGVRPDRLPADRLDEANDWLSDLEATP